MKWYNYLFAFSAGIFLANSIPHFVNGISGNAFPTPFSNPPGKGLSEPIINIVWSFVNMAIAYFLFVKSKTNTSSNKLVVIIMILGFVLISVALSIGFTTKLK